MMNNSEITLLVECPDERAEILSEPKPSQEFAEHKEFLTFQVICLALFNYNGDVFDGEIRYD